MSSFHASRLAFAAAAAALFVAGTALAQGPEPSKSATGDKAATAVKKAPASNQKSTSSGKRLDFAPTEPAPGTAAAGKGVAPAATRPATGYDKQDSHCHSSRASDA